MGRKPQVRDAGRRAKAEHLMWVPIRRRRGEAAEQRNWAELPGDVLSLIFKKLGAIEILLRAQAVCRTWRQVTLEPHLWRCIHILYKSRINFFENWRTGHSTDYPYPVLKDIAKDKLFREAINRSGGHLEELYTYDFGITKEHLDYIADRTTGLKRFILILPTPDMHKALVDFVRRYPLLEELQIDDFSYIPKETYENIGRACPELKRFVVRPSLSHILEDTSYNRVDPYISETAALEIANSMPQLRELQLIGNYMTNKGLHTILDNCLHLESLDIRHCVNVNVKVDAVLQRKLTNIKNVRLPLEPIAKDDMVSLEYCYEHPMSIFDDISD